MMNACEEPIEWKQDEFIAPRLVVDGLLTNRPEMNVVKLSLPIQDAGESPRMVSNATVIVTDGERHVMFIEDSLKKGVYKPESLISAVVNKGYLLYIKVGQFEFTAETYMIPVAPLRNIQFVPDVEKDNFFTIQDKSNTTSSYVEYIVYSRNSELEEFVEIARFYNYSLSTYDVNQFFKPPAEKLSFPAGSVVIRNKYSMNRDHERYVRSLLSETEWRGGWFDVLHGNLHTNISAGGVGYFSASTVVSDTTIINTN